MMKKVERNEFFLNWILADLKHEILYIPRMVKDNAHILSRPEAKLYFEYKNRYRNFAEVMV